MDEGEINESKASVRESKYRDLEEFIGFVHSSNMTENNKLIILTSIKNFLDDSKEW